MSSLKEYIQNVRNGSTSVEEHVNLILKDATKAKKEFNHFNALNEEAAITRAQKIDQLIKNNQPVGRLAGLPISVKDGLVVDGIESTASSRILKGYIPPFTLTGAQHCLDEGAIVIGKTTQDEFGFGSFSTSEGYQHIPKNPFDPARTCGGSSGGAGGFTQFTSLAHASIGESTGGSIAAPASFCGVVGFTPTYGRISRYGIMDYGSSLDKIGPLAKSVEDCALLLEIMAGHDPKDGTSLPNAVPAYSKTINQAPSTFTVGIVKEFFGEGINENVSKTVWNALHAWEQQGAKIKEVSLPKNAQYALAAYYIMATSEASTNLAKYCGLRYGQGLPLSGSFDEYFSNVRSEFLGAEAKRRILLGTFARMAGYRDAFYIRSQKVRTLLIQEFKKVFSDCDVVAFPTMPFVAPLFEEISKLTPAQSWAADLCTVPANLGGFPHVSIPCGTQNGLPIGLMLVADHIQEEKLLQLGHHFEQRVMKK